MFIYVCYGLISCYYFLGRHNDVIEEEERLCLRDDEEKGERYSIETGRGQRGGKHTVGGLFVNLTL